MGDCANCRVGDRFTRVDRQLTSLPRGCRLALLSFHRNGRTLSFLQPFFHDCCAWLNLLLPLDVAEPENNGNDPNDGESTTHYYHTNISIITSWRSAIDGVRVIKRYEIQSRGTLGNCWGDLKLLKIIIDGQINLMNMISMMSCKWASCAVQNMPVIERLLRERQCLPGRLGKRYSRQ
jgi:hypothetical protein